MPKGKDYELFIEKLYRELEPNAEIIQNDHIFGVESNTNRQIDVSIRIKFLGKEFLTIVQAKDYSRPADVNKVGEFLSVMKDVRANKGILICSSGFSKKAIEYGKGNRVELLTLHGAQNINWQTLFKSKIKKTTHYFDIDLDSIVNVADLSGKKVKFDVDIYSFDKKKVLELVDVIEVLVLKKMPWKTIAKGNLIELDLKDKSLHTYINDEFRRIEKGHLKLRYLKTSSLTFFLDPQDYIVEVDHVKEQTTIHSVEYNMNQIEAIVNENFVPSERIENSLEKDIDLDIIVFNYKNGGANAKVNFAHRGRIHGEAYYNEEERRIMPVNKKTSRMMDILQQINKRP